MRPSMAILAIRQEKNAQTDRPQNRAPIQPKTAVLGKAENVVAHVQPYM